MVDKTNHTQATREEPHQHEILVQAHLQLGSPPQRLQKTRCSLGVQQHLQAVQVCPLRTFLFATFFSAILSHLKHIVTSCDKVYNKK